MKYLPNAALMKKGDQETIEKFNMPSMVLMERASLKFVETLEETGADLKKILAVCGSGNNGGDGVAIARLLLLKGHNVTVFFAGREEHMTEETRLQMQIFQNYGGTVITTFPEAEYTVIIDAVFGIGLSREIQGHYREVIEEMNRRSGFKAAVDIPSGVSASAGTVLGTAFHADLTVTFACSKLGMILYPGHLYAGKVVTADIGIPEFLFAKDDTCAYTYEPSDIRRLLPARKPNSHKGSYGKVLMVTGSDGMAGAAFLSAKAAYMAGAGLVQIYTPKVNQSVLQTLLPEAIITAYESFNPMEINRLLEAADVAAIGCGIGRSRLSEEILEYIAAKAKCPLLIDADGLNLLSDRLELLEGRNNIILTPHMKELSRLLHCSMEELQADRIHRIEEFTNHYPVVCVSKDARTIVSKAGEGMFVNTAGNSAMAKAGSGDVLAGMITGLMAQNMPLMKAASLGVYLHACAGDYARAKKGSYSVLAQDLIEETGNVIKEHEEVKQ